MNDSNKNSPSDEKSDGRGCLFPIIGWGVLTLVVYVFSSMESESPGSGREMLWYGFLGGIVALFLYFVLGNSVKETASRFVYLMKFIGGFLIFMFVIFIFGQLTNCHPKETETASDTYYRK